MVTADLLPEDAPIIAFEEGWDNELNGQLVPGGAFKVAYDVDRLEKQLNLKPGEKASTTAYVPFDGQYPTSRSVLSHDALGEHVDMPAFRIPQDAKCLRVWFEGRVQGPHGRTACDSDFGRDFHLSLR